MGSSPRPARLVSFGITAIFLCCMPAHLQARGAEPDATATALLPEAPAPSFTQQEPAEPAHSDLPGPAEVASETEYAPSLHPSVSSSSDTEPVPAQAGTPMSQRDIDLACQAGALHGKSCRASWGPILWEFLEATASQNAGNIALDDETRHDLVTNPFIGTWFKCVHQFRYRQWRDDDDFMVDYVGHGMQGGIIGASLYQHSPTGRGLVYVNNGNYWRSRLKGMAWIAVYEVQWKIGPASEASIGNSGLNTYYTPRVQGRTTNETGFQDFVDTPLVGFAWNIGEDAIDRFIMPHIWRHTHNKLVLTGYSVITPCKSIANLLRFKPPYYRDFDLPPVH